MWKLRNVILSKYCRNLWQFIYSVAIRVEFNACLISRHNATFRFINFCLRFRGMERTLA